MKSCANPHVGKGRSPHRIACWAMILDFSEMDLRNSSWIAVSFSWTFVRFFEAPMLQGRISRPWVCTAALAKWAKPVKGVDTTTVIATKTKWQGNVMEEWYLQGADFSGAALSSSQLIEWVTDEVSYRGGWGTLGRSRGPESGNRQLDLSGIAFLQLHHRRLRAARHRLLRRVGGVDECHRDREIQPYQTTPRFELRKAPIIKRTDFNERQPERCVDDQGSDGELRDSSRATWPGPPSSTPH